MEVVSVVPLQYVAQLSLEVAAYRRATHDAVIRAASLDATTMYDSKKSETLSVQRMYNIRKMRDVWISRDLQTSQFGCGKNHHCRHILFQSS